jgi:hypothetical protein
MRRTYLAFLAGEIFTIVFAIMIFRSIENRIFAGAIAGSVFSLLGLWIVVTGLRRREMLRTGTFIAASIHLFAVALPMMITRLMNQALEFKDVLIWGLPGPVFHQLSTAVYMLLLLATVYDLWRNWRTA